MTHDGLASSLAGFLRGPDRMVWENIQLGPSGSPRPDVYAIHKSFVRPAPMAYEVKVSVSDFRADVTAGKWQSYLAFACGVVFACEAGLLKPAEVPEHCGLIELRGERWRYAKRPTLRPVEVPFRAMLKLLIDGVEREGGCALRRRTWKDNSHTDRLRRQHGEAVALAVGDIEKARFEAEYATHRAEVIVRDAEQRARRILDEAMSSIQPMRQELCQALALPADSTTWCIQQTVSQLKADRAKHPAVVALEMVAGQVGRVLMTAESALKDAKEGAA